jgi:hypothetical protein
MVVKDARKLKSFIQYIKQNKILNNTVTTKTISQERIILILLGLGWNFLFIGGTSLLTRAYNDAEKFKVQSINDSIKSVPPNNDLNCGYNQ